MRGKQLTIVLGATALVVAGCGGSTKSAETSTGVTIGGTSITITKLSPSEQSSAMTTSAAAPSSASTTEPAAAAPPRSTRAADGDAYAASIEQAILDGAALESTTDACVEGIEWICVISDIKTSTKAVAIVTVQITADDKAFGEKVARSVYNFASSTHPELRSVQVNNAEGKVLANDTFS
jgi:hypothetical protein